MYDSTERFSNWQSGSASVPTNTTAISLEFLFSKEEWSEEDLLNIIEELSPESTPASLDTEVLWNLAVGLVGRGVPCNSDNTNYIYFAYQCIEHPAHGEWDDETEDYLPVTQLQMAHLLISTLTV